VTRVLAILSVLALAPAFAVAEAQRHLISPPIQGLQRIFADPQSGAVLVQAHGRWMRLRASGSKFVYSSVAAPDLSVPKDAIPHSRAAAGKRDIQLAWLAGPTRRYGHGVLGDAIEAGELRVRTSGGDTLKHVLAAEFVFEDLTPRIVDVDGDGRDEILLVRSHRDFGAAVVLLGIRGGRLLVIAESPPIGVANRWLNPVGVADFDGDGRNEVAVVETPHIGGKLVLYRPDGAVLREVGRYPGFSNHIIGSTVLDMAVVLDFDRDGVKDVLLPTRDRLALDVVSFPGGKFRRLENIPAGNLIAGPVIAGDVDGRGLPDVVFWDTSARIHAILR